MIVVLEHLPGFGLDPLNGAIELARRVGYHRARVLVDIWHVSHSADTWDDVAAMPADALAYVEICDALPPLGTDQGLEMTERRTFSGEGVLDNERFHRIFAERDYDGIVSVEVVNREWRGSDLGAFARRYLASARRLWPANAVA